LKTQASNCFPVACTNCN